MRATRRERLSFSSLRFWIWGTFKNNYLGRILAHLFEFRELSRVLSFYMLYFCLQSCLGSQHTTTNKTHAERSTPGGLKSKVLFINHKIHIICLVCSGCCQNLPLPLVCYCCLQYKIGTPLLFSPNTEKSFINVVIILKLSDLSVLAYNSQ